MPNLRSSWIWIAPTATFAALGLATLGVAWLEVDHDLAWDFASHPVLSVSLLGFLSCVGIAHLAYLALKRSNRVRAAQERRLALLPRQVLLAQEAERERVARELHDELGQLLTALRLELGWLQKQTTGVSTEERPLFYNAIRLVEKGGEEVRRICRGLRPPLLDDLGLEPAIELLVREFAERTAIPVKLEIDLDDKERPVPPELGLTTYRILQESLTNVSRHAEAKHIDIDLHSRSTALLLSVYDDGRGFEVSSIEDKAGVGLAGMRQRANLVEGALEIKSRPGEGTRILFRAPLTGEKTESSR